MSKEDDFTAFLVVILEGADYVVIRHLNTLIVQDLDGSEPRTIHVLSGIRP